MNNLFHLVVEGKITPKGRPRAFRLGKSIRMYTPPETEKYEARLKALFTKAMVDHALNPFEKAVRVAISIEREIPASWSNKKRSDALMGIVRPTSRPDIDNEAKSILDALNKVVYLDDGQVVELVLRRAYGEVAQFHLTVSEIEENLTTCQDELFAQS